MLKKLRRKFILINMTLVGAVLLCVFAVVCATAYRSSREDIERSLEMAVNQQKDKPGLPQMEAGRQEPKNKLIAVYTVLLNGEGEPVSSPSGAFSLSGEVLKEAVEQALESGQETGLLRELGLYYRMRSTPEGTRIAFADAGYLSASMRQLVLTSLLVGLGGLAAFFFISLFLSRWALRPVEKAWRQQRQFVADASHELKTPLTVILANQKILLSHTGDTIAEQRRWIENTDEEARHMRRLVDDLLFLARSDAVEEKRVTADVELSDLSYSVLLQFEPLAYEKGLTLDSAVEEGVTVQGDPTRMKQLIHILLDNACKYAGERGQVKLRLYRQAGGVVLEVHNTGEAIPVGDLPHIFERFYRSDKARSSEGGFGLGLAIAKSIADQHGALLSADSAEGLGTRMTVRFRGV